MIVSWTKKKTHLNMLLWTLFFFFFTRVVLAQYLIFKKLKVKGSLVLLKTFKG